MSDTDSFFSESEISTDLEISIDRELIAVVRVNRFLYDKTEKLYANSNVKTEAWTQIGASLTHPLEGSVAEKRFYALRQRFGKERRKVMQSMPRSGAGADQPIYKPTWVLYKDLMFLKDIIKPRKTISNYKSKTPTKFSISSEASPDAFSWNSSMLINLAHSDETSTDISERSFSPLLATSSSTTSPPATPLPATPPPATPPPATSLPATPPSATPPSATLPPARSPLAVISGSRNNTAQMQKTLSNISTKRKVPPLDSFATKKRVEADAVNKSLIEQSKGLTDLATKIGQAIMTPPPPPSALSAVISNASAGIQPMLSAIEFALGRVPEHAQLQCLITVLQYINDFSKT